MGRKMKNLPKEARASFQKKGILPSEVLFLLKTDMGREEYFCDAYSVVTAEGIASLFCLQSIEKRKGAFFFSPNKTETVFREMDYAFFSFEDYKKIKCEEQISVIRVVGEKKNGEEESLFWVTAAKRKEIFSFSDSVNAFIKEGVFPEKSKEDKEKGVCPKCKKPYADEKKKICRHCLSKKSLLQKLLPFLLRYKNKIALVIFTVLLSAAVGVITPYLSNKVLYDEVLTEGSPLYGKILWLVLSIALVGLLSAVITMFHSFVNARVSASVTYDLKKTIFSAFERLSFSFFTSRHTGRLITQINSDAESLYWFFCDGIPYFLTNLIQVIGVIVVMFSIHAPLTLMVLIPIPVIFFGYVAVLRMFRRLHAEQHTRASRFNSVLSDVLSGMRIVKAFSREETEIARFDQKSRDYSEINLDISIKNNTIFPLLNLGVRLSTYFVWGFGGYFVLKEASLPGSGISFGVLSLFVSYLTMLYTPLNFFANFLSQTASGMNALQRLFQIVETEPEVVETKNALDLESVKGEVKFEKVNFSYVPGKRTIQDVSFTVPAGNTLGIVGHTGAGKSTLANLLTRLYDVESGAITIDGRDIRSLSLKTLRRHIAIVSQETYLFRGTIMDNIRYASPDATEEEVLAASRAAGCHDFIMTFPDGYDTMVGMDKKMLSGGEKQRISIARAILKDPAILILDEATAAMDTKTERRIQEALAMITKNRTTITIAHRLSTLRDADSLIVIEDGKVVEEGTHESLLAKEGTYHKLYSLQMQALKTIGIEE